MIVNTSDLLAEAETEKEKKAAERLRYQTLAWSSKVC